AVRGARATKPYGGPAGTLERSRRERPNRVRALDRVVARPDGSAHVAGCGRDGGARVAVHARGRVRRCRALRTGTPRGRVGDAGARSVPVRRVPVVRAGVLRAG